ncbi:PqqD family protein [[Eubacterium] cellulosolvens]
MSKVSAGKNKRKKPNGSNISNLKKKKGLNLLDLIPVRSYKWTRQKENKDLIRILKPRFDSKLGKRLGDKFKLNETYNINLDEYGTAVWRLCDGKLTVREIGEILKTQFADDVEPLYPRLAAFLRILESQHAIEFNMKRAKKKLKE